MKQNGINGLKSFNFISNLLQKQIQSKLTFFVVGYGCNNTQQQLQRKKF